MNAEHESMPSEAELEETFAILRAALSSLPEPPILGERAVPENVLTGAHWVHDWLNMDAELAWLTHDSSLDSSLASVRSKTPLRHVTFECENYVIEIEIETSERGVSMTGAVSPPAAGTVRAVVGGTSHEGQVDEFGNFLIDDVNHGVVMAYVTTEGDTIRLGSFEI